MSCNEWERGTITIPSKEWAGFRKGIIMAWNQHRLQILEKSRKAHDQVKAAIKGKRGSKRVEALQEATRGLDYDIRIMIVNEHYDREKKKYVVALAPYPKKKDAGTLPLSKDADIHLGDASIYLRNDTRSVIWSVGENNHARDHAHEHWLAKELFHRLGSIKWTRGSGGTIVGNDEYNRDCDSEGGGANYVTFRFGPKMKKKYQDRYVHRRW
jgi:hypothetical protein